jgi:hypothetical protein
MFSHGGFSGVVKTILIGVTYSKSEMSMVRERICPQEVAKDGFKYLGRLHLEKKSSRVSETFRNDLLKMMESDIFPRVGRLDVAIVTPQHLVDPLRSVEERRGTEFAHRICSLCGEALIEGIVAGRCEKTCECRAQRIVAAWSTRQPDCVNSRPVHCAGSRSGRHMGRGG